MSDTSISITMAFKRDGTKVFALDVRWPEDEGESYRYARHTRSSSRSIEDMAEESLKGLASLREKGYHPPIERVRKDLDPRLARFVKQVRPK